MNRLIDAGCYWLVMHWPDRWFYPQCRLLMWAWPRAHDHAYRDSEHE